MTGSVSTSDLLRGTGADFEPSRSASAPRQAAPKVLDRVVVWLLYLYAHANAPWPLTVLLCLCLAPVVTDAPAPQPNYMDMHESLTLLALNVNGWGARPSPKKEDIYNLLARVNPHVAIFGETRQAPEAPIQTPDDHITSRSRKLDQYYKAFAAPTAQTNPCTGVTILVRNGIPATQVQPTPAATQGRAAAVDVTFPDIVGRPTRLRIIGVYAPVRPNSARDTSNLRLYWESILQLIPDTHGWVVIGDCNAYLHPWEEKGGDPKTYASTKHLRAAYRFFITEAGGKDVWEQHSTTDVGRDWTCHGHASKSALKILDRAVTASAIGCSSVRTLDPVALTNHRPLLVKLVTGLDTAVSKAKPTTVPQHRLRKPKRQQAEKQFQALNESLRGALEKDPPPQLQSDSPPEAARALLDYVDTAFVAACETAFRRPKPRPQGHRQIHIRSPEVDNLAARLHAVNRLKFACKNNSVGDLLQKCPTARTELRECCPSWRTKTQVDLAISLNRRRNEVKKALINARKQLLGKGADVAKKKEMETALKSGRVKQLFQTDSAAIPMFFKQKGEDGQVRLAASVEAKIQRWDDYFQDLYRRDAETRRESKPWLESPASVAMAQMSEKVGNFQWPVWLSTESLRAQLGRGNPKPSPGPDSWEKWALKACNAEFLKLVTDLANYMIANNYFPSCTKENWIVPLPKPRDDLADMKNWRGIVHSNCLYNLVTACFTNQFQAWVWDTKLLAPTQVATQQGVQIGDLTSFLEQLDTAAKATGTTICAIKRDHVKGFDNLDSSAFLDSLKFFGINDKVAEFEMARTERVTLRVKSADGPGKRVITTTGQTKQGDPLSPLKYTMVMSMFHHWVHHGGRLPLVNVMTKTAKHGRVQVPADRIRLRISSVEAMDDSILFHTTWKGLIDLVHSCEIFQGAYGIQTAWDSPDKTVCFMMGHAIPKADQFAGTPMVPFKDADGNTHKVPLTDRAEMLRTAIASPARTKDEILEIVDRFAMPRSKGFPIAILRRAVNSLLMGKIRSKLLLQPVTRLMATEIDQAISRKVTGAMGLAPTLSAVLSLPLEYLGFDFPSVTALNGKIAIERVLRGLNHHITPFRQMASITMANWQCQANHCAPPLETMRPDTTEKPQQTGSGRRRRVVDDGPFRDNPIPDSWRVAREYLDRTDIRIVETDQSHWRTSPAAHIIRRAHVTDTHLDVQAVKTAYNRWPALFRDKPLREVIRELLLKPGARLVLSTLRRILLPISICGMEPSVFIPRQARQKSYRALALACVNTALRTGQGGQWATDGSSKKDVTGAVSSTAAIVGPASVGLGLAGQFTSSMHAERLGLIVAMLAASGETTAQGSGEQSIVTDHLNSVRDIDRVRDPAYRDDRWRYRPGHELYNWLVEVARSTTATVQHVKAHTGAEDDSSRLNEEADAMARRAHVASDTTWFPPLTGWMRRYVPYVLGVGFCPDNWAGHYMDSIHRNIFDSQTVKQKQRLNSPRESDAKIPEYFYRRAPAGVTAKFQLIMRLGVYQTEDGRARMYAGVSPACMACGARETEEHIFVHCPKYRDLRTTAVESAVRFWKTNPRNPRKGNKEAEQALRQLLASIVNGTSTAVPNYWRGQTAKLPLGTSSLEATVIHHMSITLTSRIAGERARQQADRGRSVAVGEGGRQENGCGIQ